MFLPPGDYELSSEMFQQNQLILKQMKAMILIENLDKKWIEIRQSINIFFSKKCLTEEKVNMFHFPWIVNKKICFLSLRKRIFIDLMVFTCTENALKTKEQMTLSRRQKGEGSAILWPVCPYHRYTRAILNET